MTPAQRIILFGQRPLWTPAELAATTPFWFTGSDPNTVHTATGVDSWTNKGNLGGAVTQATGVSQPTLTTLNGKLALAFNGTTQVLTGASQTMPASTNLYIGAVFVRAAGAGAHTLIGMGIGALTGLGVFPANTSALDWINGDMVIFTNGFNASQLPRAVQNGSSPETDGAPHVFGGMLGATPTSISADGTATTMRVNTGAASVPAIATSAMNIGSDGAVAFWIGTIAEVVVTQDITPGNVLKMEGYLAWNWGLQANLPSAHPYRYAPPRL